MDRRIGTIATGLLIVGGLASLPARGEEPEASPPPDESVHASEAAPAADITTPAFSLAEELREYRRPYEEGKWRVGAVAGTGTASVNVQRKFGERTGFGLGIVAGFQPRRVNRTWAAAGVALQWWGERANRIFPGVVGWTAQAGPVGTAYSFERGTMVATVARGAGLVAAYSVHATMPVLNVLFDARPAGWVPHVTWEIGLWGGWIGAMKNAGDTDVDGDGANDHFDGDTFRNPDGRSPPAWIGGLLLRSGLVWVL